MTKHIYILLAVFVLAFTSCKTHKPTADDESGVSTEEVGSGSSRIDSLLQKAPERESAKVVEKMAERFSSWNTVMLSAQLQMDGLPLSPSLKIFMEKGKSMSMSVRAPFIGEVGRLEFANDTVVAVNKMKNVYAVSDISQLMGGIEFTLSDLQDVFLARAFAIGEGTIVRYNKSKHGLYHAPSENYFLPPMPQSDNLLYGFTIDGEGMVNDFLVHDFTSGFELYCLYQHNKKSYNAVFEIQYADAQMQVILDGITCQWEAQPLSPIKFTSRMREVSVQEFLQF